MSGRNKNEKIMERILSVLCKMKSQPREGEKEVMTAMFFYGSGKLWYGQLKRMLAQQMLMGTNQHPLSLEETMNIINTFSKTS